MKKSTPSLDTEWLLTQEWKDVGSSNLIDVFPEECATLQLLGQRSRS